MKNIFLVASILFSLTGLSCPDLSGSYSCSEFDDQGGTDFFTLDVSQTQNSFDISLNGEESEVIVADGVTRSYDSGVDSDLTAYCSGDKVLLKMVAEIDFMDVVINILSNTEITKENGILTQKTISSADGELMKTTVTCYPN